MEHTESYHVDSIQVSPGRQELERARRVLLAIAGVGCPECVNRVRNALLRIPGVVQVHLALHDSVARVWHHEESVAIEDLVAAVSRAGQGTHHTYLAVPLEPWVPDGPGASEVGSPGDAESAA